jgi:hypothetical protein
MIPIPSCVVGYAADWEWSSVRAHLAGKDDGLVTVRPVLDRVSCFSDLLLEDRDQAFAALRRAESTGRPVGTAEFVTGLERVLGRRIARTGPRSHANSQPQRQAATVIAIGIWLTRSLSLDCR